MGRSLLDCDENELPFFGRRLVSQTLIDLFGYKSYLEIGCYQDQTFTAIDCEKKIGVDPVEGGNTRMTSDDFFAQNNEKFDCIFIDGWHHYKQVHKDVQNALQRLSPNGSIVMHDCSVPDLRHEQAGETITAWRVFVKHREFPDLVAITCNFDHGVGVIRRGKNKNILVVEKNMDELCFADLDANRKEWLNLLDKNAAVEWMKQQANS